METRRNPHDLAILAVEAMVRKCLTWVAFTPPAAYPGHARATSRPLMNGSTPAGNVALQLSWL
jgi:hypothetical protein